MRQINESHIKITGDNTGGVNAIRGVTKELGISEKSVMQFGSSMGMAFGAYQLGGWAKAQVQDFIQLEKGMANVNTIIGVGKNELKGYQQGLLDIKAEIGGTNEDLTGAMYQTVSAGIAAGESLQFVKTSAMAARAGLASTETSVDTLTTLINSYHMSASEANSVSDMLFTTIKLGKTNFEQIAGSIANVTSLAASSGIEMDQLLAGIATLTKQGVPTSLAVTQIRAAIIALNEQLGDGWSKTMTMQDGMKAMADKAGGSNVKLQQLTGRVEAMGAVLAMTGDNAKMAADDLDAMASSGGEMMRAFGEQTDTIDFKLEKIGATLDTITATSIMQFGDTFLDILNGANEAVTALGEFIADWDWYDFIPPVGMWDYFSTLLEDTPVKISNYADITATYKNSLAGLSEQQIETERTILAYYWDETYLKMQNAELDEDQIRVLEAQLQAYSAQAAAFDEIGKKQKENNGNLVITKTLTEEEKKKLEEWQREEKNLNYQINLLGAEGIHKELINIDNEYATLVAKFGEKPLIIEYITKKKEEAVDTALDVGVDMAFEVDWQDNEEIFAKDQELSERKRELWLEDLEVKREIAEQEKEIDELKYQSYAGALNSMANSMGAFYRISGSQSVALLALQKISASSAAVISAKESVVHSYKEGAKYGGPILGAAWATIAGIAQAANVAAIWAVNPGTSSTGGGSSYSRPLMPVTSIPPVNNYNSQSAQNNNSTSITINFEGHSLVTDGTFQKIIREEIAPMLAKAQAEGAGIVTYNYNN